MLGIHVNSIPDSQGRFAIIDSSDRRDIHIVAWGYDLAETWRVAHIYRSRDDKDRAASLVELQEKIDADQGPA